MKKNADKQKVGSLPLCGFWFDVYLVKDLRDKQGIFGQSNAIDKMIELDLSMPLEEKKEVLIHECVHMVADVMGFKVPERNVRDLGIGLHQMLGEFIDIDFLGD